MSAARKAKAKAKAKKLTPAQKREAAAGFSAGLIAGEVLSRYASETAGTPTHVWKKVLMEVARRVYRAYRAQERRRAR